MSFGRVSEQLDKNELSQLLIKFALSRITVTDGYRSPTQAEIAEELDVSQPMINGVIHGKKHFSKERFAIYADKIELSLSSLLQRLLSPHWNNTSLDQVRELKDEDHISLRLLNGYESICRKLRNERAQALQSPGKTFDIARAFSELLTFVSEYTAVAGVDGRRVALISVLRDGGYGLWREIGERNEIATTFRFSETPEWLCHIANSDLVDRDVQTTFRSVPNPRIMDTDATWAWLSVDENVPHADDFRLACQHVFTEEAMVESENTASHYLLFSFDGYGLSETLYDHIWQVLFLASRFGEMVAMYCLQDRLHSAARVIDLQMWRNRVAYHQNPEDMESESAEFYASQLLSRVTDMKTMGVDIVTADIWLLHIAANRFECPSEHFQFVSPRHANRQILDSSGEGISIAEVYARVHRQGDLTPRPFGRTNYMVANCVATFTNRADTKGAFIHWTSCPELEFGTFIGIPFIFMPKGDQGLRHVGVLYLRCNGDLKPEDAKRFIQRMVGVMNAEFQGRFVPLFAKRKRALSLLQRSEKEWGRWYEVYQKPKTSVRVEGCIVRPGDLAPISGQYQEFSPRGGQGSEVIVVKGEPLPPSPESGAKYRLIEPVACKCEKAR